MPDRRADRPRLDSWKAIAAYLGRDVSTVQRWERREGLPIHRLRHRERGSVSAIPSELDAWRDGRTSHVRPQRRRMPDIDAFEAYLRAKRHSARWSLDNARRAIALLEAAVHTDPQFALAYAELARTWGALAFFGHVPASDVIGKELAAARRAVEIDPVSPDGHVVLATATFYHLWDWQAAEAGLRRALELDSDHVHAHQFYAWLLAAVARFDAALVHADAARRLAPIDPTVRLTSSTIHLYRGSFEMAVTEAQAALALDAHHVIARLYLGWALGLQGQHADALRELHTAWAAAPHDPFATSMVAYGRGIAGHRDAAREALGTLEDAAKSRYVPAFDLALGHIGLGEHDRALTCLESAFRERANWLVWLNVDQRMDPLRGEPRFERLMERMAFPSRRNSWIRCRGRR